MGRGRQCGGLAAELVVRTALKWRDETRPDDDGNQRQAPRHGQVQIPLRCLSEIVDKHVGFASRINRSPVLVNMDKGVDEEEVKGKVSKVATQTPGSLVEIKMRVSIKAESSCA